MPEFSEQHFPKQPEGPKSPEQIKKEKGLALVQEIEKIQKEIAREQKRMEEEGKTLEGYQKIIKGYQRIGEIIKEIENLYEKKSLAGEKKEG